MNRIIRNSLLFLSALTMPLAAFSLFNVGPGGMSPFKMITAALLVFAAADFTIGGRTRASDRTTA